MIKGSDGDPLKRRRKGMQFTSGTGASMLCFYFNSSFADTCSMMECKISAAEAECAMALLYIHKRDATEAQNIIDQVCQVVR